MASVQAELLAIASEITSLEPVMVCGRSLSWANTQEFSPGLYVEGTFESYLGRGALQAAELRIIDEYGHASLRVSGNEALAADYEDSYAKYFREVFSQYIERNTFGVPVGIIGLRAQSSSIVSHTLWVPGVGAA